MISSMIMKISYIQRLSYLWCLSSIPSDHFKCKKSKIFNKNTQLLNIISEKVLKNSQNISNHSLLLVPCLHRFMDLSKTASSASSPRILNVNTRIRSRILTFLRSLESSDIPRSKRNSPLTKISKGYSTPTISSSWTIQFTISSENPPERYSTSAKSNYFCIYLHA